MLTSHRILNMLLHLGSVKNDHEHTGFDKFLEICCLKDEYGSQDPIDGWTTCKISTGTVLVILIIFLFICRAVVGDNGGGYLGFAALVLILYYIETLIYSLIKPQGVHYLIRGNMRGLKKWKWHKDTEKGVDKALELVVNIAKNSKPEMVSRLSMLEVELQYDVKSVIDKPMDVHYRSLRYFNRKQV